MVRFPRPATFQNKVTSSDGSRHPISRTVSPFPGRSTLMTSAPKSAKCRAQPGPARTVEMSMTRRSDNGDLGTTETLTAEARCRAKRPLIDQGRWVLWCRAALVASSRSCASGCHRTRPPAAAESPARFRLNFLSHHDSRSCDLDGRSNCCGLFNGGFRRDAHARRRITHNGMFPCLRCGSSSRLDLSISRPAMTFMRVSAGSMTSSMNPRSAATYGFANRSV